MSGRSREDSGGAGTMGREMKAAAIGYAEGKDALKKGKK
jgi:hypothetical protein